MFPGSPESGCWTISQPVARRGRRAEAYPQELRRQVLDLVAADRPVGQIAHDLDTSAQTIHTWRKQQLIDSAHLPRMSISDHGELAAARKRIAELENELAIHRRAAELPGDVEPPKRRYEAIANNGRRREQRGGRLVITGFAPGSEVLVPLSRCGGRSGVPTEPGCSSPGPMAVARTTPISPRSRPCAQPVTRRPARPSPRGSIRNGMPRAAERADRRYTADVDGAEPAAMRCRPPGPVVTDLPLARTNTMAGPRAAAGPPLSVHLPWGCVHSRVAAPWAECQA
jgi:transposase